MKLFKLCVPADRSEYYCRAADVEEAVAIFLDDGVEFDAGHRMSYFDIVG